MPVKKKTINTPERSRNGDIKYKYQRKRRGNQHKKKELIPGETLYGKPAFYAYEIDDPTLPAPIKIANAPESAWWMNKTKVEKLIDAYRMDCSNREACFYAGITAAQLNTFLNKHPDFKDIIAHCKEELGLYARKNVASNIKSGSVQRSWDYLTRKHKGELGDSLDLTSGGKPLNTGKNTVVFMDFSKPGQTEPVPVEPEDVEVIDNEDDARKS